MAEYVRAGVTAKDVAETKVTSWDVLEGQFDILPPVPYEESKPKYFHQNYIRVENNGKSEQEVVERLGAAFNQGRALGDQPSLTPTKIFNYGYNPIKNKAGKILDAGTPKGADITIVRVYDPSYYQWLFAVDDEGEYTFDIDNGDNLSPLEFIRYNIKKAKAEKKVAEGRAASNYYPEYRFIFDYWRKAHPVKIPGITQIPQALRKYWKLLLDDPDDIAVLMLAVSPAEKGIIENELIIEGLTEKWTETTIRNTFSRYSSSTDKRYPQFARKSVV